MKKLQKDSLGDRMKVYEGVTKLFLMKRTPIIIRLDGKAFHTFTRGFDKPHDDIIRQCMNYTMLSLCENTQGVRLGYTQSDEISFCWYFRIVLLCFKLSILSFFAKIM